MITVKFPRVALKAVARFAGIKDIRYYLNGVYIESSPAETRLTATNGHALASYRHAKPDTEDTEQHNVGHCIGVIVPNDIVKTAAAWKAHLLTLTVRLVGNVEVCTLSDGCGAVLEFKPIDGKFPDYLKVIPKAVNGEIAQYNPDYLALCKAAQGDILGKKHKQYVCVGFNGTGGPCVVDTGIPELVAIVMPWRVDAPAEIPAWIGQPVDRPAVTAPERKAA